MAVANLSVSLTARTGQFSRAMRRAERAIGRLRGAMGRIGGAATAIAGGGMGVLVGRSMQLIDAQAKVAARLNANQREMAGLDVAARRAGVSTQTLSMGMQRMTRRIGEAAQGSGEAKDALKALGLDATVLATMSADQQFMRIADAMAQVENGSRKVGLAMKIFDSEGVSLINAMQGGSQALAEAQKEAERFGLAIDEIDAAKVEEANDAMARLRDVFIGFFNQVAVKLAPFITEAADAFVRWATEGDGAAAKVESAIRNYIIPAVAKVADMWDFVTGGILASIAKVKEFGAAVVEFLGGDASGMRQSAFEDLAAGKEKLDRVFGARQTNQGRILAAYEGVITAATERAAEKVSKRAGGAFAAPSPAAKASALKIGEFREVDLRRIALGGAAGIGKKQEVTGPELKTMVELLRRMTTGGSAPRAI